MLPVLCLCALLAITQSQAVLYQSQAQPTYAAPQKPQAKTVIFPDLVKKSPLNPVNAEKQAVYNHTLNQLTNKIPQNQTFPLLFQTRLTPNAPYQIQIPVSGAFQLLISPGTTFKILDNNATDGQATLQAPSGTLQMALQLQNAIQEDAQLKIKDTLYHLQDTLKPHPTTPWMHIGLHPLPAPKNWHSENGNHLVLHFHTHHLRAFNMLIQHTPQKAPYPPGIHKIGPKGGTLELPGVAKLELPPGALTKETVVSLHQEKEAKLGFAYHPDYGYVSLYEFYGGVIRIEPFNTKLNQSAKLFIDLDFAKLENSYRSPRAIGYAVSSLKESWLPIDFHKEYIHLDNRTGNEPTGVKKFKYYTRIGPKPLPENQVPPEFRKNRKVGQLQPKTSSK